MTIPSHIAGATAGSASTLASRVVVETVSKWKAISGAVASVAAIVTARPSASARAQRARPRAARRSPAASGAASSRMPSTAAKLSCQPTSAATPGSTASVAPSASASAYSREARRPAERRQQPRRPHHRGPLDRGTAAGERQVDGDQAEGPEQPLAQRDAERAQNRGGEQRQQGDVLSRDGQQVAEPGAAEVLARPCVDRLVLAEHEAPRQRGLARRHPAAQPGRGALADLAAVRERRRRPGRRSPAAAPARARRAHRPI